MALDVRRYIPCFERLSYEKSLFEVKSVLLRNEVDDGRPILLRQHQDFPGLYTVMGAKIDNIYDLFSEIISLIPGLTEANEYELFSE